MIDSNKIHRIRKSAQELRYQLVDLCEESFINVQSYSGGEDRYIGLNCIPGHVKIMEALGCIISAEEFLSDIPFTTDQLHC